MTYRASEFEPNDNNIHVVHAVKLKVKSFQFSMKSRSFFTLAGWSSLIGSMQVPMQLSSLCRQQQYECTICTQVHKFIEVIAGVSYEEQEVLPVKLWKLKWLYFSGTHKSNENQCTYTQTTVCTHYRYCWLVRFPIRSKSRRAPASIMRVVVIYGIL